GNRDDEAQVGFDQLALGLLGVNVALDNLALGALELLERNAGFDFEFLEFGTDRPRLATVFLLLVFAAGCVGLTFQVLRLAIQRTHGVDGLVDAVDQVLALDVGEAEVANAERHVYDAARQLMVQASIWLRVFLLRYGGELLLQLAGFLIGLPEIVDFAGEFPQAVLKNFIRDLFLIEGDHFLNG